MSVEVQKGLGKSRRGSQAEQASQEAGNSKALKAGMFYAGHRLLQLYEDIEEKRKKVLGEKLAAPDGAQRVRAFPLT